MREFLWMHDFHFSGRTCRFLQEVLGDFTLIPPVIGAAEPEAVSEALSVLWNGPETLIVIGSDLSHYHDYNTAQRLDQAISHAIEALRLQDIRPEHACGRNPINGLLYAAHQYGLRARTVDLRNSGDTAGPRDEVVGYGAYVFIPETSAGGEWCCVLFRRLETG